MVTAAADGRSKDESHGPIPHDVGGENAGPRFQAAVGDGAETHASDVILGSLFGVGDPPGDMVVTMVSNFRGWMVEGLDGRGLVGCGVTIETVGGMEGNGGSR